MSSLRAFTRSYMVVLPDYPLLGHRNQGYNYIHVTILIHTKHMPIEACLRYISNQAVNTFRPTASTSEHYRQRSLMAQTTSRRPTPKFNKELDTMVPGSCPQVPGSYPQVWVPAFGFQAE
ncbi:hypothetical protein F2Q69_00023036 [Brassica cretica]|uniref:Uncharacterized protein n=1 Tax=Brassica cretica TaxID=69181 RepID=A0A8S9Q0R5_BRACR|nr:hypothetical protein F2Q69_00023036 [Brassica cretica]